MSLLSNHPILSAALFGVPSRQPINLRSPINWKWKMDSVKEGRVYKIKVTDNTNEIAERLQMNICGLRALVVSSWFGKVYVKINIARRGVWTEPVLLEVTDLMKIG